MDLLKRKPGAAARLHGAGAGPRRQLLLHRHLPATAVQAGLATALAVGSCSPDVVAAEARKAHPDTALVEPAADAGTENQHVISLTQRRLNRRKGLPVDTRKLPSVAADDQLLSTGRQSSS